MSLQTNQRELLPEQAAAAYTIDRHISVTAGPGSGKTTVLVERYLHILREHPQLNIDQIVAITFTNRAANEMRERLREQLNLILQTAAADERKHWLNYKRTLDGAIITTIHGFCARLLREFPVEAGVDPQFLLLDEHRAAMLLEAVVEESLTQFISAGHVEISRLTLGVGRGRLAQALAQIYRDMRGQGLSLPELSRKTAESHATEDDHAQALVELQRTMDEFLRLERTTLPQKTSRAEVITGWSEVQSQIKTIPEVDGLADYCRAIEGFRKARPSAAGKFKAHVQALDTLVWEHDLLGRVPQVSLDLFAKQYALEVILLLTSIDERLKQEKQKLSALDFDDLELRALTLLARPEVITRATERYKFFLVDEFQDTNGLQRQLLERLALQKARRGSANLFIVGDSKQSIYGFRGADVGVFSEMTETLLAAGGEVKPLLLNFRSQPPLIHFFNYLFERLFQSNAEITPQERKELGYVDHDKSVAKRDLRDSGPLVELMVTTEASGEEDDRKAEQTSRELDAEQLALRIVLLVGSAGILPADDGLAAVSVETENVVFDESRQDACAPTLPAGEEVTTVSVETENVVFHESRQDACAPKSAPRYSDIALLFRAMTNIQIYESAFRRANIPYQTVLGRGFYEREEITDLIQLLRFLDNKTDELALAAVLRSPLGGISDNGLLALRCGPWLDELDTGDELRHFTQIRPLYVALLRHSDIAFINDEEHQLLDRAAGMIKGLIARQHNYSLSQLLRFAVDQSDFQTVIAATFDGAQRLANVQRLFTLAERFESSGAHLIRDFVRYVEEFEAIGSRESEGQIDEATNAVKLMTIHQAKGLEFPIVIIPDLQRSSKPPDDWFLLDRQRGLTLKVPDGRGKLVAGCTFTAFEQRHAWREQFESMRLLYVAATRAEDRLILSGTTKDLDKLGIKTGTWLNWIWQSLELPAQTQSGIVELQGESGDAVQLQLTVNLAQEKSGEIDGKEQGEDEKSTENAELTGDSISEAFPLLRPIEPERDRAIHRFSVTQLINYQRCPRQYYFDRVLHAPAPDALAVWNDAEAPEPPANLTATIKGAVIHRFCETYSVKDDPEKLLRQSFGEVVRDRQAQLADRLVEINENEAITELFPLAQSYLQSAVFERVERARALSEPPALAAGSSIPLGGIGLWSELSFRLRRPLGILTGAIDKLLISPAANGQGFDIEVIDFKTNRLRGSAATSSAGPRAPSPASSASTQLGDQSDQLLRRGNQRGGRVSHPSGAAPPGTPGRPRSQYSRSQYSVEQIAFDFNVQAVTPQLRSDDQSLEDQIRAVASDYQLQMQAYALAVRELMPSFLTAGSSIRGTLHFLEPALEFNIDSELLSADACMQAIDDAMMSIVSSVTPGEFPLRPANHCRMCNFLTICPAGREWVCEIRKANC